MFCGLRGRWGVVTAVRAEWVCKLVRCIFQPEPAASGASRGVDAASLVPVRLVGFVHRGVLSDAGVQFRPDPALLRSLIY